MPIPDTIGAFAIIPSNNLHAAVPFWERLGFTRTGGDAQYIIMTGWGCEEHLTQAGSGPWMVPERNNPFGVYIRTPEVDAIAIVVDVFFFFLVCVFLYRVCGFYDVVVRGPEGLNIRIGWPSR